MAQHDHSFGPRPHLKIGVITCSDTRTPDSDESGTLIRGMFEAAGHDVTYYELIPDSPERLAAAIVGNLANVDTIIISGGTGITSRDTTIEALRPLLDAELAGFGELFRALSYQEIGSKAILSRTLAGIRHRKFIAALPGSPAACRLAMEKLILPELAHIHAMLAT